MLECVAPLTSNRRRPAVLSCYYSGCRKNIQKRHILEYEGDRTPPANLTVELLRKANRGDRDAMNRLFERLAPPLQRFARGRLPGWARGMIDTADLVQETLVSAYQVVQRGDAQDDGAIHAYLRTALKNRLIDELRRVNRRPQLDEMDRSVAGDIASPLEQAIGAEALERYESALAKLKKADRDAVLARIELGLPYSEIATLLDRPSADAARMSVSRALVTLAGAMADDGSGATSNDPA